MFSPTPFCFFVGRVTAIYGKKRHNWYSTYMLVLLYPDFGVLASKVGHKVPNQVLQFAVKYVRKSRLSEECRTRTLSHVDLGDKTGQACEASEISFLARVCIPWSKNPKPVWILGNWALPVWASAVAEAVLCICTLQISSATNTHVSLHKLLSFLSTQMHITDIEQCFSIY